MNAQLALKPWEQITSFQLPDQELMEVMRNSVYPGAKDESIRFALTTCKAASLDPLQKPYHLVPMSVKKPGTKDQYEWRDVVMPGIGLYRIQAARTGEHAGTNEPEFGPMIELELGGKRYTVPEWCKVTVYRMRDGQKNAYTAIEFWIENYATAGRETDAPNTMWRKRPRGQLAKCSEAQALRKAFPEVGNQATAEEMAGKSLDDVGEGALIDGATGEVLRERQEPKKTEPPLYSDDQFTVNLTKWTKLIQEGKKTSEQIIATVSSRVTLTEEQKAKIRAVTSQSAEPQVTYAQIADAINKASSAEAIDEAAALISAITDEAQRNELNAAYKARRVELEQAQ